MNVDDWVHNKPVIPLNEEMIMGIELKNEFGEFRVGTNKTLRNLSNPVPIRAGMIRQELKKHISKFSDFQYAES